MATATAKPPAKPAKDQSYPVKFIPLNKISANSAQSRGTGALGNLQALGWGMFEKIEAEKEPIWLMLMSSDEAVRQQAVALLTESEPTIIEVATSLVEHGQVQPVGAVLLKDGTYDILYGMQRCAARAYNWIMGKGEPTVEAKILPESELKNPLTAKLKSRAENRARRAENPIDVALFYKELKTEFKLTNEQIAERDDCSPAQVGQMLKLLDPRLEDKRYAIQTGEMPVYKALDRLERLKQGNGQAEKDKGDTRQRGRWPSTKIMLKAYGSGIKPKKMDDALWELCKLDDVRKFIAKALGVKFMPYRAPTKKALAEAEGTNGTAKKPEPAVKKKPFTISRAGVNKTLICLGLTNAATLSDADACGKLENITALGEKDMKLEDKGAQAIFDKLMAMTPGSYTVQIKK